MVRSAKLLVTCSLIFYLKKRWLYYLPTYSCSCRNVTVTKAVITVAKGLNIAQYKGPLSDMHHDWTKKLNAIPIPYFTKIKYLRVCMRILLYLATNSWIPNWGVVLLRVLWNLLHTNCMKVVEVNLKSMAENLAQRSVQILLIVL